MVFVGFAQHLLALDLPWLFQFITGNLLWVFIFTAMGYYVWEAKGWKSAALIVAVVLTLDLDFINLIGWTYLTGAFLMLEMVTQLALTIFTENTERFKGKIPLVTALRFMTLLIIYNVFLAG